MPEGDTVWFTARRLHRALAGQALTVCDVRVPQHATVDLTGQTVDEVISRGKHLLIRVGETTIHSHLRMEGIWEVYEHGERWRHPTHSARVILSNAGVQAVGFWLGMVDVVPRSEESRVVGHLGPDLLGPDWDPDVAIANLARDPERAVFLALHDQRNLAGLGNEYVNELLFLSGALPTRPVSDVELPALVDRAHRVISTNRDRRARTFTGSTRRNETTWVFNRDRQACRRCGTPLQRGELGDDPTRERQAWWCPHCQS
ncbi:MAG: DNA-formamidopyrimidine glycosylase family protein [Aeromicrobium sp.]